MVNKEVPSSKTFTCKCCGLEITRGGFLVERFAGTPEEFVCIWCEQSCLYNTPSSDCRRLPELDEELDNMGLERLE